MRIRYERGITFNARSISLPLCVYRKTRSISAASVYNDENGPKSSSAAIREKVITSSGCGKFMLAGLLLHSTRVARVYRRIWGRTLKNARWFYDGYSCAKIRLCRCCCCNDITEKLSRKNVIIIFSRGSVIIIIIFLNSSLPPDRSLTSSTRISFPH